MRLPFFSRGRVCFHNGIGKAERKRVNQALAGDRNATDLGRKYALIADHYRTSPESRGHYVKLAFAEFLKQGESMCAFSALNRWRDLRKEDVEGAKQIFIEWMDKDLGQRGLALKKAIAQAAQRPSEVNRIAGNALNVYSAIKDYLSAGPLSSLQTLVDEKMSPFEEAKKQHPYWIIKS